MNQIRIRITLEHETSAGRDLDQDLRAFVAAAIAAGYTVETGISETHTIEDLRPE